jgi:predicted nucleic acid-binding protein
MNLVIDTNILISALLKDSITRKIIVYSDWNYYYPEISFHEVRKYKSLVLEKTGMTEEDYSQMLQILLKHITLIPEEQFIQNLKEAKTILEKIDPDDIPFLALAISIPNAKIWSNDQHLSKQNRIKVLKTVDVKKMLYD